MLVVARRLALMCALRTAYGVARVHRLAARGVAARAWLEPPQPETPRPANTRSAPMSPTLTQALCARDLYAA